MCKQVNKSSKQIKTLITCKVIVEQCLFSEHK